MAIIAVALNWFSPRLTNGALEHRHRTGVGQLVDTSLVDAGVALSVWEATEYFSGAGVPAALGSAHRMNAPYQAIRCADGYITLGAANERRFRRRCEGPAREWGDDPMLAGDPRSPDELVQLFLHGVGGTGSSC